MVYARTRVTSVPYGAFRLLSANLGRTRSRSSVFASHSYELNLITHGEALNRYCCLPLQILSSLYNASVSNNSFSCSFHRIVLFTWQRSIVNFNYIDITPDHVHFVQPIRQKPFLTTHIHNKKNSQCSHRQFSKRSTFHERVMQILRESRGYIFVKPQFVVVRVAASLRKFPLHFGSG